MRLDHVGIAVRDLTAATALFRTLLGREPSGTEDVPGERVRVAFFQVGETRIELLEPTAPDSPVAKFLEKRGEGIHHFALAVADVDGEAARLRASGATLAGEPRSGAGGARVAFVHPKSAGGVLVELSSGHHGRAGGGR